MSEREGENRRKGRKEKRERKEEGGGRQGEEWKEMEKGRKGWNRGIREEGRKIEEEKKGRCNIIISELLHLTDSTPYPAIHIAPHI